MPLKINCPDCETEHHLADRYRGEKVKCKTCGIDFKVDGRAKETDEEPPRSKGFREEDEDEKKPKSRRRHDDGDDDEDEKPKSKSRRRDDDYEDEDDRPKSRSKSRRRDDDDDDDEDRGRRPRVAARGRTVGSGSPNTVAAIIGGIAFLVVAGGIVTGVILYKNKKKIAAKPGPAPAAPGLFAGGDDDGDDGDNGGNGGNNPNLPPIDRALANARSAEPGKQADGLRELRNYVAEAGRRAEVIKLAEEGLKSHDQRVGAEAARTLQAWRARESAPALMEAVKSPWPDVRNVAMETLASWKYPEAIPVIASRLRYNDDRGNAARWLVAIGPPVEKEVLPYLEDPDQGVRNQAHDILRQVTKRPVAELDFLRHLGALKSQPSGPFDGRGDALRWLAANPNPAHARKDEVVKLLEGVIKDSDGRTAAEAVKALYGWGGKEAMPAVLEALKAPQPELRNAAMIAIKDARDPAGAVAVAARLKEDGDRGLASQTLQAIGPEAEKAVLPYLSDPSANVRNEAYNILKKISKMPVADLEITRHLAGLEATPGGPFDRSRDDAVNWFANNPNPDHPKRAEVAKAIQPLLKENRAFFSDNVARAMKGWAGPESIPALVEALDHPNNRVRHFTMEALGRLKAEAAIEPLVKKLADNRREDRQQAVQALIEIGPAAEKGAIALLTAPSFDAKIDACKILAQVGTATSLKPLGVVFLGAKNSKGGAAVFLAVEADKALKAIRERAKKAKDMDKDKGKDKDKDKE